MPFFLFTKCNLDFQEDKKPLFICEAKDANKAIEAAQKEGLILWGEDKRGFVHFSQFEVGDGFRRAETLEELWETAKTWEWYVPFQESLKKTHPNLHLGATAEELRKYIPNKLSKESMSEDMFSCLQVGDLVQFGDKELGVTNRRFINRWMAVDRSCGNKPPPLRSLKDDGRDMSHFVYRIKNLYPHFIRDGEMHTKPIKEEKP